MTKYRLQKVVSILNDTRRELECGHYTNTPAAVGRKVYCFDCSDLAPTAVEIERIDALEAERDALRERVATLQSEDAGRELMDAEGERFFRDQFQQFEKAQTENAALREQVATLEQALYAIQKVSYTLYFQPSAHVEISAIIQAALKDTQS